MNEALLTSIRRTEEVLRFFIRENGYPDWLALLTSIAESSRWPMGTWSPGQEGLVARALVDGSRWVMQMTEPDGEDHLVGLLPAELFLVSEPMDVHEWEGGQCEFWRTRMLRFNGLGALNHSLRFARLEAEAENHGNLGWHIHPMDKAGRHYGYKMLFDASRTQQDLSWELHSHRGKRLPWGSPEFVVLSEAIAGAIHRACEAAVLKQAVLRHQSFSDWAARFQEPGNTAYVAHPPVPIPTKWSH